MNGYIILNSNSKTLTENMVWYEHDDITDAYVFTHDEAQAIFVRADKARYKDGRVTLGWK